MNMPDFIRPVTLSGPVTTNGGVASDYISLKNVHEVYVVATMKQTVAHATSVSIYQATDVSGTSAKALANAVPLWSIADITATDLYTKQTSAVSAACAATTKTQKFVFRVKADALDVANSFDCLNVVVSDSSQATNFCAIDAIVDVRYGETTVIA